MSQQSENESAAPENTWQQYAMYVDLYKTYVEILIKFNVFVFAIVGGVLSYVLGKPELASLRWALLLPAMLSLGQIILLTACWKQSTILDEQSSALARQLHLQHRPSFRPLWGLIALFLVLHAIILFALIFLIAVPTFPTNWM